MLNPQKVAKHLSESRKAAGLTQNQLAERLHISFQAVSKWETGAAYPGIETLYELSRLYGVTVDLLLGGDAAENELTYSKAGVDVTYTDAMKTAMARHLETSDARVLHKHGDFAALYDIKFEGMRHPVLALKAEEPGSKQKLAMQYGFMESVCHDMINHLVNDILVMGARPFAVLDTVICGNAEKDTVQTIVKGISEACRNNGCTLVGGETSIQPDVLEKGVYVLSASAAGVVEKDEIIDGSGIEAGDVVLAVASNGLHTNGYSLVRMMLAQMPELLHEKAGGEDFLTAVMKPHVSYYKALKEILAPSHGITGMAHITGGGIQGNLCRVIPEGLSARVDISRMRTLPVFETIRANGAVSDAEMLRTFNCGVGLAVVVKKVQADAVVAHISRFHDCYEIGVVEAGAERVALEGRLTPLLR